MTWLLLIYTVPAKPSRSRAAVWREIKRAGAVYLRDGVCALPEQEDTLATFQAIASKVEELGGQATLAQAVHLDEARARSILDQAQEARAAEYADVKQEISAFTSHIQQERAHHEFTFSEFDQLEADLVKLRRWWQQIRERDFRPGEAAREIRLLLDACESTLKSYMEEELGHSEAVS